MEEQQIQMFVQRYSTDARFRSELTSRPERTLSLEGATPAVTRVMRSLMPQLAGAQPLHGLFSVTPKFWG